MDGPLVGLVQHDDVVGGQVAVDETLSEQHTLRHVLDLGLRARAVLETDRVANLYGRMRQLLSRLQ